MPLSRTLEKGMMLPLRLSAVRQASDKARRWKRRGGRSSKRGEGDQEDFLGIYKHTGMLVPGNSMRRWEPYT